MADDHNQFLELKTAVRKIQEDSAKRLTELEEEKKALIANIDADELSWYENVRNKCGGSPVAKLSADHVCSGCHTIVPPITFKRTSMGRKTICENCGRTLFVEE